MLKYEEKQDIFLEFVFFKILFYNEKKRKERKKDTMEQMICEKIKEMRESILSHIQDSIRIDSVSGAPCEGAPYGKGPKAALEHALHLGESFGLKTKNVDDRAGWVEYGEGEEMIAVLGHLDVVPAGDGWNFPPFGGEICDGRLYGRGVLDDKGPVIGAICGLKAIKDLGIQTKRRIRVIFGCAEETGCDCIHHYIACGEELPSAGFTPDGDFPLIFFEKGMTTVEAGKKMPQMGKIKVLQFAGGVAKNVVTPNCTLVLEGIWEIPEQEGVTVTVQDGKTTVYAEGNSAHGSTPEKGINAAIRLLKAVQHLDFGGDFQQMMNFILKEVGEETNGKTLGIYYFDEETGETTVNLGIVSYTPEEMRLTLDIRHPKNAVQPEVAHKVEEALGKYGMEVFESKPTECLYVPLDSLLVKTLMKVYREQTGRTEKPMAIGGGTYAKMFRNMVAFGPVFPDEPSMIHQANESADLEQLMKAIEMITIAAVELAVQ